MWELLRIDRADWGAGIRYTECEGVSTSEPVAFWLTLTVLGSVANLIVVEQARREGLWLVS